MSAQLSSPAHVLITGASGFIGRAFARRLQRAGTLGGRALGCITLLDVAHDAPVDGPVVRSICGSIADPEVIAQAFDRPVDTVLHLASIPGGAAEQNPVQARAVNLQGTLNLLDACQAQVDTHGPVPRFVFASTIAVFGADLPAQVDDATPACPAMSYGAHKLMGEIAVADQTRRGGCDGVSLRLPGVLARPPVRTGQLSAFLSDLMRDPAAWRDTVCPMSATATSWAASTPNIIDNLLHAATFDPAPLPAHRALTLPALRFSMAQLVDALASVYGEHVRTHVRFEPDARTEALFGRFPALHTQVANAAGFEHDGTLTRLVQRAVEPC